MAPRFSDTTLIAAGAGDTLGQRVLNADNSWHDIIALSREQQEDI
jgi:hypothetical protein